MEGDCSVLLKKCHTEKDYWANLSASLMILLMPSVAILLLVVFWCSTLQCELSGENRRLRRARETTHPTTQNIANFLGAAAPIGIRPPFSRTRSVAIELLPRHSPPEDLPPSYSQAMLTQPRQEGVGGGGGRRVSRSRSRRPSRVRTVRVFPPAYPEARTREQRIEMDGEDAVCRL